MDSGTVRIAVFKPGVAGANTAFEAMAHLYRHCQDRYDAEFELFVAEEDTFRDPELTIHRMGGRETPEPLRAVGFPRGPFYTDTIPDLADFDVIVTTDPTIYLLSGGAGIVAGARHGARVLVDVSSTTTEDREWSDLKGMTKRWLSRRTARTIDAVLAASPKALDRYRALGMLGGRTDPEEVVLGHPVDTESFAPSPTADEEALRLLSVGRLDPEKGHRILLRAFSQLESRDHRLTLTIVGDGPEEEALQEEAHALEIDDAVEFRGEVPHDRMPEVYQGADIHVSHPITMGGWAEFFGVANLEAMASGLPVVSTTSGGVPHVVPHGEAGFLVPERDIQAVRDAVQKLVSDPKLRRRMGERGRHRASERFSIPVLGEKFYRTCRGMECESSS